MSTNSFLDSWSASYFRGIIRFIVLAIIKRHAPIHGYGIMQVLLTASRGQVKLKAGTLYPILKAFTKQQLIEEVQGIDPMPGSGPPRNYYTITAKGELVLEQMRMIYEFYDEILASILLSS